jgi:excisionase family DNA binding protein
VRRLFPADALPGALEPMAGDNLMKPGEVALFLDCSRKTVARLSDRGVLSELRTLGGHRRYRESEVRALLAGGPR